MKTMYKWQMRAYGSWAKNEFVGVIEAVTGAGKTLIAKFAIDLHLRDGYNILIIVPSVALQEQWYKILKTFEQKYKIVKIGGKNRNIYLSNWRIIIGVVNTIVKLQFALRNDKGLLIADECHHYGSYNFSKALKDNFQRRLGLTATYERQDNGIEEYLNPYFKSKCYSLGYKEALEENVISHFKIAFIGVNMSDEERKDYKDFEITCTETKEELVKKYRIKNKTFGEFIREVTIISNKKEESELILLARKYLFNFNKKKGLLADIKEKYDCLKNKQILKLIKNSNGTIIFSQRRESALKAVEILNKCNINAKAVEGGMDKFVVKDVLAEFESGDTEVIAAPLLLDEGIDVPSADLAFVFASHSNKRQMIQRMGRILRKKEGNKIAKIIRIYAIETSEDPYLRAHEDFLEDIIDVADGFEIFDYQHINNIYKYFT